MKRLAVTLLFALMMLAPAVADDNRQWKPRFTPPPAKEGYAYPECYCTDSTGERVEIGEETCLTIGERQIWAWCDMSLNNPTWRYTDKMCPSV